MKLPPEDIRLYFTIPNKIPIKAALWLEPMLARNLGGKISIRLCDNKYFNSLA